MNIQIDYERRPGLIRHLRLSRGWSMEQMAKICGYSKSTQIRAERDGRYGYDIARAISAGTGVPTEEVMCLKVTESNQN